MRGPRHHRWHAARVAATATAIVVAVFAGCAVALSFYVVQRLTTEVDARIDTQLAAAQRLHPAAAAPRGPTGTLPGTGTTDPDEAPVFVWRVDARGVAVPITVGAPPLVHRRWTTTPVTRTIDATPFRLEAKRVGTSWLVGGESVAEIGRARSALVLPEILFGVLLAVATFIGSLIVGLRASAPLDVVRRRQAEFTADASHELRTPLSVVEAEVDLALQRPRTPGEYQAVLTRIAGEGRRLRRIVDDLLWLARADSEAPGAPDAQRADVESLAEACASRFQAVAARRGASLAFVSDTDASAVVQAPAEWVDRLVGVLIDNACKYAGDGGTAAVTVHSSGQRVHLCVDDSGPGIPPSQRGAVFDRFRRATTAAEGSGLGLAIADSVVRMTGGSWEVRDSDLGGAHMEVSWRRAHDGAGPLTGRSARTGMGRDDDGLGQGVPDAPGDAVVGSLPTHQTNRTASVTRH